MVYFREKMVPVTTYMPKGRKPMANKARIVWVDCEMTGLEVEDHRLVEIACIITEPNLDTVAEFGPIAISQPPEVIENMSDWCKKVFEKNGLTKRIKLSETGEKETEQMLLEFLRKHVKQGESPLAGNSIYMDKMFLRKYMPEAMGHLHEYRLIDVSSIKELVNRWYAEEELRKQPPKKNTHLALDDIRESIAELKYYKENFFRDTEI